MVMLEKEKEELGNDKTPLHLFIEDADFPVAMFDQEMRYLAASQPWIDYLLSGDRGVIGRSHYDVVTEVPQQWRDMHRRVLAGETLRDETDAFRLLGRRALWVRREMRPWRDLNGKVGGIIMSAHDITTEVETQRSLRESEERLRLAVTAGRMGMFDWDIRTGAFLWSDEWYRMLGYEVGEVEPSQDAWLARVHPDDREKAYFSQQSTRQAPKEFSSEYRIVRSDGDVRWIRTLGRFLFENGKPVRLLGLKQDVTEAHRQIETQRVLVGELQHRTRNLMAVVQSIAHQTLDNAKSLADFEDRFNHRLEALSRVQTLLSRADNQPVTLGALIAMELEPLGAEAVGYRISLSGPEVLLRKSTVEMLSLAIHELLTNAIKYGALATESGRLSIGWHIDELLADRRLVLEWVERGVAMRSRVADATPSGYGRKLIEEALRYTLSAETKFELGGDGLRCRISLPLTQSDRDEAAA